MGVKGGYEAVKHFCKRTRLFTLAASLGGVKNSHHPKLMKHASAGGALGDIGGADDLVSLRVGVEAVADLAADLEHALAA